VTGTLTQLRVPAKTFAGDVVAGLVMAIVSVPGALANGVLAGVNPVYGLYSLIAGTTTAALFTSSFIMNVDSTSAIALATSDALRDIAPGQHLPLLVVMTVMVGAFQLAFGIFRLGFLTRLISNSVMIGFLTGIALLTILSQVGDISGYDSPVANKLLRAIDTARHAERIHLPTLAVGCTTIAVIWLAGRAKQLRRYSYPIGLAVATMLVALPGLDSVALVGDSTTIPRSLPHVQLPDWSLVPGMIVPAIAIAIIGLVQAVGVSQSVPNPDGRFPDVSGDFRGQGAGNLAAGITGGLPVGGSLSGTTLIRSCGGKSRWANIFTGVFGLLTVLFAARLIELLPMAGLGGLLVMVGIEMFRPGRIRLAWRTAWLPRTMMIVTFAAVMSLPLQYAILLGVALHMVLHAIRAAEGVRVERIIRVGNGRFQEAPVPAVVPSGEVLALQPIGGLFFAGAAELEDELPDVGNTTRAVVILRLRNRDEVGSTFLGVLRRYAEQLRDSGSRLMLAGVDPDVIEQLERTDTIRHIGRENVFVERDGYGESLDTALDAAQAWLAL
jgi:SulP family sulfate permease